MDKADFVKVAVIVPCYNQAVFLADAVNSVIQQEYANWECIIVNDNSTDETALKAAELADLDDRIRWVSTPDNLGLAGARNFGIEHANADYILPLDADDKISPDYISKAINVFNIAPSTTLVYAKAKFFGNQSGNWELPAYHYGLLFARNPIYCSAIFKKSDWEACQGYDINLKNGLEDWDFWIKLLTPKAKVVRLDITGFFYRKHEQSMIADLVNNEILFEQTKDEMLLRHRQKWLSWSFEFLDPLLSQMQYYKEREKRINSNALSRLLYLLAKQISR